MHNPEATFDFSRRKEKKKKKPTVSKKKLPDKLDAFHYSFRGLEIESGSGRGVGEYTHTVGVRVCRWSRHVLAGGQRTRAHAGTFSQRPDLRRRVFIHARRSWMARDRGRTSVARVCTRPDDSQPLSGSLLFPWMNLHRVRRASSLHTSVRFSTLRPLLPVIPWSRRHNSSRFVLPFPSSLPLVLLVHAAYTVTASKLSSIPRARNVIWSVKFARFGCGVIN